MRSISLPSEARLFDGESARPQAVVAAWDGAALQLSGAVEETVPAALLSREASTGRITLHRSDRPDWRLVLPGSAVGFEAIPRLHRMTSRSWSLLGGSLAAIALVAGALWLFGNQALVWAAPFVPRSVAEGVGAPYADLMAGGDKACETPAGRRALDRLVARVKPVGGFVEPVRVRVARDETVNAFTLPGGEVILLDGLIQSASGPDEVAGVLAHEFGHVQERHPNQALIRHFGLDVFLSGIGGNLGGAASTALFLTHSRGAEAEADAQAVTMLVGGDVSTAGLAAFFKRQEGKRTKTDDPVGRLASLAATHPSDTSREARFRAAARSGGRPALSAADWQALKRICG